MYTIDKDITSEYTVNKSKFITKLIKIDSSNIEKYIKSLQLEYKDANHFCYAYIFDNFYKASDDKEPSNTAGLPILNILQKNNLNHILCVVVRYFGGVKLGIGGLIRAYTNSVITAVDKAMIIEINKGYKVRIKFSYDNISNIDKILINYFISYKNFENEITYEFEISVEEFETIKKELENSSKVEIIEEIFVKI